MSTSRPVALRSKILRRVLAVADGSRTLAAHRQAIRDRSPLMRISVSGGEPWPVVTSEGYLGHTCSQVPSGGCVLVETDGKTTSVWSLDAVKGRGVRLFRDDISRTFHPDGKHLAYLLPENPQRRIRITDLRGSERS